jgi:drug/metabolite transporter (DMT)-like permease
MSRFLVGNLYLVGSMVLAVASQLLIKTMIDEVRPEAFSLEQLRPFLEGDRLVRVGLAAAMVVGGFVCWILCLVKLELSYAYPIVCTTVLFVALASALFLGEAMTLRSWLATGLVLAGLVLLVSAKSP